jgi:iduronate 2-sulfatase
MATAAILFTIVQLLTFLLSGSPVYGLDQTNLLLIMFDDLRPELSIYGRGHMITPNFERLAARSVVFDQAYCQVAVCNPSRDSLMTGLRPDTTGTYAFQSSFRPHLVFPTQLGRSGYKTAGYGKLVHWESNDPDIWNHDSWENGYVDRPTDRPDRIFKHVPCVRLADASYLRLNSSCA